MPAPINKFKEDYPEMYDRFREMNRALARLLREKAATGGEGQQDLPEGDELPTMLEWD